VNRSHAIFVLILSVFLYFSLGHQQASTQPPPQPMSTRDSATVAVGGSIPNPRVAMLVGAQVSSSGGFNDWFQAQPLLSCDRYVSKEVEGPGEFPVASSGKVHVCSYSISNGNSAQEVQFIAGNPVSSGSGHHCNYIDGMVTGPVTAPFRLSPNQFISQGIGIGSLFWTESRSAHLCLAVRRKGQVSVLMTYAVLP
jgi:hypothetical protein